MRYLHDAGMGMNMLQHERPFRQAVQQTALTQKQQRIFEVLVLYLAHPVHGEYHVCLLHAAGLHGGQ